MHLSRRFFLLSQNLDQVDLVQLLHLLHVLPVLISEDHSLCVLLLLPNQIETLLSLPFHIGQVSGILILDQLVDQVVQVSVHWDEVHLRHGVVH